MRHGEMCEPCGECQWCFARHEWIRKARQRARVIKRLARVLAKLAEDLEDEANASGAGDHPTIARHARDAARARKVLASIRAAA